MCNTIRLDEWEGGNMLRKETLNHINKLISESKNLKELANELKNSLSEREIQELRARLIANTADIDPYIKPLIEELNAKGFKTISSSSGLQEDGHDTDGYLIIRVGNNERALMGMLENLSVNWEINYEDKPEKEIKIFITGTEQEKKTYWDKMYKEINK